jgi:hypothetical protein
MLRRREELPMFARHLIGPAAELRQQNLRVEANHERQLSLLTAQETSLGARSGGSVRMMALNRIVHAARSLLTLRATGVVGTGYPSPPQ